MNLNQVDPDSLFKILTENVGECLYYDASKTPPTAIRNNQFFIILINIRSLHKHHDDLVNFLALCRSPPDIICITETRLQAEPLIDVGLPGYTFIHENSPTIIGGVAMYIKNSIKFERPGKYNFEVSGCENIWIDVKLNNNKNLVIGTVYRHPKQNPSFFIEKFSEILHLLNVDNATCFILGDMNININKSKMPTHAVDYTNILKSYFFFQLIDKPTGVTDFSQSIIDHIITNDHNSHIAPGVIEYGDFSDHYPVFVSIDKLKSCNATPTEQIVFRNRRNFQADQYCNDLESNLNQLFAGFPFIDASNVNDIFSKFMEMLIQITNKHAPLKQLSRRQMKLQRKPWITKVIYMSIRHKQQIYKSFFLSGNPAFVAYFKKYANLLTKIKCAAKRLYHKKKIEEGKYNPRTTWQVLREYISTKKNLNLPTFIRDESNVSLNDPKLIAEAFNEHFSDIGDKLAAKIQTKHPLKVF